MGATVDNGRCRSLDLLVRGYEDVQRDLAALVVPRIGGLRETGHQCEPYALVDAAGVRVEPVAVFLTEIANSASRPSATAAIPAS